MCVLMYVSARARVCVCVLEEMCTIFSSPPPRKRKSKRYLPDQSLPELSFKYCYLIRAQSEELFFEMHLLLGIGCVTWPA